MSESRRSEIAAILSKAMQRRRRDIAATPVDAADVDRAQVIAKHEASTDHNETSEVDQ